jgi:hypothetical protein
MMIARVRRTKIRVSKLTLEGRFGDFPPFPASTLSAPQLLSDSSWIINLRAGDEKTAMRVAGTWLRKESWERM